MKQFIKNNWFKISLLAIIFIVASGWFYWVQIRPAMIVRECFKKVKTETESIKKTVNDDGSMSAEAFGIMLKETKNKTTLDEDMYKQCLLEHGIAI
jgi:hypothetical protein